MAEQLKRSYFEILDELVLGKNSAIDKLAKVCMTEYEMNAWWYGSRPLNMVDIKARKHFATRFLDRRSGTDEKEPEGEEPKKKKKKYSDNMIKEASKEDIEQAFTNLHYAVGKLKKPTGCYARCMRLMNELNECLAELGLRTMVDPGRLIDWLTFEYTVVTNDFGRPIREDGEEIRIFQNDKNLKDFKKEIKALKKAEQAMSMHGVLHIIYYRYERSVSL